MEMGTDTLPLPEVAGYRAESVLGVGGMATVYLAVQESLSRYVALKVMNQVLVLDAGFRKRFLNEGRLIAQLSHRNIVTVHDIGVSGAVHYLSMTYLPGGTLREKIDGGLPLARALEILKRLADALGYAHRRGIVHRDIKPGNVLFTEGGDPVLTDFGIAKSVSNETQLTSTGMAIGSAKYMSPEQALGEEVDSRSDLYSLGVLFWQMLTGGFPYDARDPFALALKHAKDPIPRLPDHLRRFQPLMDGLLAKQRGERIASAEALLTALEALEIATTAWSAPPDPEETVILPISAQLPNGSPTVVTAGNPEVTATHPATPNAHPTTPKRSPRWLLSLLAAGVLAGLAGFLAYTGKVSAPWKDAGSEPDVSVEPARAGAGRPEASANAVPADIDAETAGGEGVGKADHQRQIATLLERAQEQFSAGRLTEPAGDNAFESYSAVLSLDPEQAVAKARLVDIGRVNAARKMFTAAEQALRSGAIDDARHMIETGLKINPDDERLLGLQRALD